MQYPAQFEEASEGGYVVTFRDIPEAITQGDTEAEALVMAADALVTAMDFYFEDHRLVPAPSKARPGDRLIDLPPSITAKVLLLNEMIRQKVCNAELARRIGISPQEMQRIANLGHTTKIDTIDKALRALGCRMEIVMTTTGHH